MLSKQEEQQLSEASQVLEMAKTQGWSQILEPWLRAKRDQSFPDPASFRSKDDFLYAALAASSLKKAIAEILVYVEDQAQLNSQLKLKKQGKLEKTFNIGG